MAAPVPVPEGARPPRVRASADAGVARVLLDRPPLNVLDLAGLEELAGALDAVAAAPDVRVVLLTGAGRAFSAGVDVADHTPDRVERMMEAFHAALACLGALDAPVVAAVNGPALGGGMELALACDVVLASEGAKLGQPEVRLGVFPPFAATALPRLVGRARALDLCLTGRVLSAREAEAVGLVQRIFPADGFEEGVREYAGHLASLSAPVLRLAKRAVTGGLDLPFREAMDAAERVYLDELVRLDDAREGLAAFLDKRAPVWRGS